MIVSRTGYTGEDGFEISLPAGEAEEELFEIAASGLGGEEITGRTGGDDLPSDLNNRRSQHLDLGAVADTHVHVEMIEPDDRLSAREQDIAQRITGSVSPS